VTGDAVTGDAELPSRVARNEKGSALVATRDLPAGAVVARFAGPFVRYEEIPPAEIRHALWFDTDRWMIPATPARFLNHGCAPNCELRDRPGDPDSCDVVTIRPVAAGEELSFSYDLIDADAYFADADNPLYEVWHPSWSFDCLCGAPNCRGRIDGYTVVGSGGAQERRSSCRSSSGPMCSSPPTKRGR
jgi:hypothetical protein